MGRGLFITGTDTGVGKTHVAALILRQLVPEGMSVTAFKPACSGAELDAHGRPTWDDVERLLAALDHVVTDDELCPQRFLAPLAPPIAALKESRRVDESAIDTAFLAARERADVVVIEGAGGWLCPLTASRTFADWAADWQLPVLIVARPGLGTINHTLLTIESIRRRQLEILGVVLNATHADAVDESTADNVREIETRGAVSVLGLVRYGSAAELLQGQRSVTIPWVDLMRPLSGRRL